MYKRQVYDILRDEYDIQIEFGDIGNILAYLSIGDRAQEIERLVSALAEIRRRFQKDKSGLLDQEYIDPQVVTSPQEAFYAEKCSLPLRETEGKVCSEFVMCYPPGIPILAPGERITPEILDYIEYALSLIHILIFFTGFQAAFRQPVKSWKQQAGSLTAVQ